MPRMPKEARETRDALVMRMFLAGVPYRDIGKHALVSLSAQGVHNVVKAQMKASAKRRDFISDNAYDVHVERLESLYAANYAKAVDTKIPAAERLKAGELCRRILNDLGKIHGIEGLSYGGGGGVPPARVDDADDDLDDDNGDELSEWRKKTRGA